MYGAPLPTAAVIDEVRRPKYKDFVDALRRAASEDELIDLFQEHPAIAFEPDKQGKLPLHIAYSYDYTTEALNLEDTLCKAMQGLTSAEFEGVLHPVFEEDELKLILVGAVLGLAVGIFQLVVMFGGGTS